MAQDFLTQKELRFVKGCLRCNRKFETLFSFLFIFTVILPVLLAMTVDNSGLRQVLGDASYYFFAVSLGWLVVFLNERWLRIINKLILSCEE